MNRRLLVLRSFPLTLLFVAMALLPGGDAQGQGSELLAPQARNDGATNADQQQRRRGFGGFGGRMEGIYKRQITPHWFANNTRFWYRNDLGAGAREFIVVDAERGTRERAFDHSSVAKQIGGGTGATKLPVDELEFSEDMNEVSLSGSTNKWLLNLKTGKFGVAAAAHDGLPTLAADTRVRPTVRNGDETEITFDNRLEQEVEVFWVDSNGEKQPYGTVQPRSSRPQHTYSGHVWLIANQKGETVAVFEATDQPSVAVIGTKNPTPQPEQPQRTAQRERRGRERSNRSADGKWTASIQDGNVFIRAERGEEIQLSKDGASDYGYGRLEWAPDSKALVAWRIESGERKEVCLVRSSPSGGGRAQFESRPYAQAGDRFTRFELSIFDIAQRKQSKPKLEPLEHEWLSPRLHWSRDGRRFSFMKVDRGHQRLRVIEVDVGTGQTRNLIDEQSKTFIWTAHAENLRLELVNYLEKSDEIIYVSEQDGWRHLYLVDDQEAKLRQITKGEWVVRGIERIDEDARQIWFSAGGKNHGQDPYFVHHYRVNFDGSGLVALTESDGNHTIQFSPDRKYIVDTYSRPDAPPAHELRRTAEGGLVCKLEQADATEWKAKGGATPEVFVAKGRDGNTDIWGLIHRPRGFDSHKKYPIIESIYAGPQGSFVPKSFGGGGRFSALTDLGFIVVQIDGMGTANRSKAFHDVCWHNLKDGGFPDRILWMKAAAAKHAEMDITRVGVYGNSAGGQNAAAAVLFHPQFYKAAVASCGCHDNRLDKASWNEQWMGYMPPEKIWNNNSDNWYSQCSNIDNAERLQGKLFLIVGETDHNVPPESTLRLADALIKANKDFDLLVIPGGDHGMGGAYGERRMHDFFVRNLLGTEPPNRNATTKDVVGH